MSFDGFDVFRTVREVGKTGQRWYFGPRVVIVSFLLKYQRAKTPTAGHEGPEVEWRYSSTLSLTLVIDGVGGQRKAPAVLPPGNRLGNHCTGDWVWPQGRS